MGAVLRSALMVIFIAAFIIGILGNGFIVLVNCVDWAKSRKLSSVDQILTALAISRVALLWVILVNWWAAVLQPALLTMVTLVRMIYISWTLTNHFSVWLATSLSIFYFLKIAKFSNSVFLYLKWRVQEVVTVTLLASLTLLFINVVIINAHVDTWAAGLNGSTPQNCAMTHSARFPKLLVFPNLMFTLLPFTVSLTTFFLLIVSLRKHLRRMQRDGQGGSEASTAAHVSALRNVVAFLLLYTVFFLSILTQVGRFGFLDEDLIILFGKAAVTAFPSGHACVLILGNSKLRQSGVCVAWLRRCRCRGVEPRACSGPFEDSFASSR